MFLQGLCSLAYSLLTTALTKHASKSERYIIAPIIVKQLYPNFFKRGRNCPKQHHLQPAKNALHPNVNYRCALDHIKPANVFIFTLHKNNSFEKLFFTCFTFRELLIPLPHYNVMPSIAVYIVKKKEKEKKQSFGNTKI